MASPEQDNNEEAEESQPKTSALFTVASALDWQSIVNEVNNRNDVSWTAEVNPRFAAMTREQFRRMNGAKFYPDDLKTYKYVPIRNDIPEEFNSGDQWPDCESITHIYDQGHCGSCWAMATFESLQDRFCIHSNGTKKVELSAQHLTSCEPYSSGCDGGSAESAFAFCKGNGITTEKCIPCQMGTCKHPGCSDWPTPKCNRTCYPDTTIPIDKEKYYAESYAHIKQDEATLQTEIMTNGPVAACFTVYTDLASYKSGVYHHVTGSAEGGHCIKIVGWGVLNGEKYWKIANSWNTDWGMDGYLLMRRGTNECGIEGRALSGMPLL